MSGKLDILLVSSAFYPELSPRSFRATELAKEFHRLGHRVVVLTRERDHDYSAFLARYPISLKRWSRARFPSVPGSRRKPFGMFYRALSRLLQVLFEYPAIEEMFRVKRMLRKEEGYDLMMSFAVPYPVHWGAARAWRKKRPIARTWVADCGDPYMGDVLDSFRKPFYFGFLEKQFCRKADYVAIPVESARPAYYREFHPKIRVIPQGFDFDLQARKSARVENPVPAFAYAGGFLQGIRDPRPLLDYLVTCDRPFLFRVFTNQPEILEPYRANLGEKLAVSGYIDRDELLNRLSEMDFLINFDNHTSLNVPSKLIDYVLTNRPVLNINRHFDPGVLLAFLDRDYSLRMQLPDPEQYHIGRVAKQFLDLLKTEPA
jgi:hypothetical protein